MRLQLTNGLDCARLIEKLKQLKFSRDGKPVRWAVQIEEIVERSLEQNQLQFVWYRQAARVLKELTAEQHRAYCKLHFGVPVLRQDETFRASYDGVLRPLQYEQKLRLMEAPLDFPITSLMNQDQMNEYMDAVYAHFTGLGVELDREYELARTG